MTAGRRLARAAVAAVACAGLATAHAAGPPAELPRAGCAPAVTDPDGDAYVRPLKGDNTSDSYTDPKPALDILGIHVRVTPDEVQLMTVVKGLPADGADMEQYAYTYRYKTSFKAPNGKVVSGIYEIRNTDYPAQLAPIDSSNYPIAFVGTTPVAKATLTEWPSSGGAPGYVLYLMPRAEVERLLGSTLQPTDALTEITATAQILTPLQVSLIFLADETTATGAAATWTVGNERCFGPPPTRLADLATASVRYRDVARLRATLTTDDGTPLAGRTVAFTVGHATPVTAKTDDHGIATASWTATLPAGTYPVAAEFAGAADAARSTATGTLTVLPEVTAFGRITLARNASGTRTATVVLTDDERSPLAGLRVDWYVDGRRVTTATTDRAGRATLANPRPGQQVQARFDGVQGQYLASRSGAVKVA